MPSYGEIQAEVAPGACYGWRAPVFLSRGPAGELIVLLQEGLLVPSSDYKSLSVRLFLSSVSTIPVRSLRRSLFEDSSSETPRNSLRSGILHFHTDV